MTRRLCYLLLLPSLSMAADWPIYRGADRTGISLETEWKSEWSAGPTVLWSAEVGIGFASFTVVDGRVYTTGNEDEMDTLWCLDATTGALIWKHAYAADLGDKYFEGGTAATPTVHGGKVFQLSRWGDVMCLDAAVGTVVWSRNLVTEKGYKIPDWGFAGSPVVSGDMLILNVGDAGVALKVSDGSDVWVSGNEEPAGYSTPFPVQLGSKSAMILSTSDRYLAVEASTGNQIWEIEWKTRYGVNAAEPVVKGDQVFLSSGYNKGGALVQLNGETQPNVIWENKNLRNQFNSSILLDGYLYGIHDDENKKPDLRCVEWATGEVQWEERSIGFGAVAAAAGTLIVQTEKGELAMVEANPDGYREIFRGQVLSGRCWTTPVLANGLLYVRNADGEVKCLDLR